MERELYKILSICLAVTVVFAGEARALTEKEHLDRIEKAAALGSKEKMEATAREYFKKYPRGNLVADARLILAENEGDPDEAVKQYEKIVANYRYFKKRDYAQYKLCEILYLTSKWEKLRDESIKGIRLFRKSPFENNLKFYLAQSQVQLGKYEIARDVCAEILRQNRQDRIHAETLLLMSLINRKMYGFSRGYLTFLYEFITSCRDSEKMPAAVFMLGNYYESKREFNKACSAYSDIIKIHPRSMESIYAAQRIEALKKYNPRRVDYHLEKMTVKKTDDIDIKPEMDIEDKEESGDAIAYSISIGPFSSLSHSESIKKLLIKDFDPVKIVEITRKSYKVYAGKYANLDAAISMKTRLAEEFGINGIVVRMIRDTGRLYIYEE